ncbi:MAG: putative quinol monooxygenase [Rikenellaceae bacterium]
MIRLNAFALVSEQNREEFVTLAKELVAASQKEDGCIAYDLFESATRPEVVMFCETWKDDEALKAHDNSTHFTTIVPKLAALGEMKLERFEF